MQIACSKMQMRLSRNNSNGLDHGFMHTETIFFASLRNNFLHISVNILCPWKPSISILQSGSPRPRPALQHSVSSWPDLIYGPRLFCLRPLYNEWPSPSYPRQPSLHSLKCILETLFSQNRCDHARFITGSVLLYFLCIFCSVCFVCVCERACVCVYVSVYVCE